MKHLFLALLNTIQTSAKLFFFADDECFTFLDNRSASCTPEAVIA
jgi:hypothetical protein